MINSLMQKISVVINCTKEEIKDLSICLKTISNFADEIIIVDMGAGESLDKLQKTYKLKIYPHPLLQVVEPARNFGISKATNPWILILDPDERLSKSLKKELLSISSRTDIDYVRIPRKNIIFGKWLHYTGSWPDHLLRFFKKDKVTWSSKIHVQPIIEGKGITLQDIQDLAIKHYNYRTISDYLQKANRYTDKKSEELLKEKYSIKISDLILKPVQEFNSRFFFQKGYKDGIAGLIFSSLQAFSELLIYSKVWEKSKTQKNIINKVSMVSAIQQSNYELGYWFTKYLIKEYSGNPLKISFYIVRQFINRLVKNW